MPNIQPDRRPPRIAVLISFTGDGGVENMVANLIGGFIEQGIQTDVLLIKARGRHVDRLPEQARIIHLNARTSALAVPAVVRYLRQERPDVMLAAKDRAGRVALLARRLAKVPTRIVLRMGMHLSGSLADKSALRRWSRWAPVRRLYPQADRIITVAPEIADDLAANGRIPRERFAVVPNPSVPPRLEELKAQPVEHAWLQAQREEPTLIAVGRLKDQKDFPTLLRAFAILRAQRRAKLIILGEGSERKRLEKLALDLGVAPDVDMPGFVDNPYAWMARADLFVLSSAFEGSPNVLVEALACGTPAVATDCPSGPRGILKDGRFGPLVPVGDYQALATACAQVLDHPTSTERLAEAVVPYTLRRSTHAYLKAMGITE